MRFKKTFKRLESKKEIALIPYIIACDPDKLACVEIMHHMVLCGADALNLGFAFSDPGTAGPALQLSNKRALKAGFDSDNGFETVKQFRKTDDVTPIAVIVYANAVLAYGKERFFKECSHSGVDAVLIPDLPYIMLQSSIHNFKQAAEGNCNLILCATENCDDETLKDIASHDAPYIYTLSDVVVSDNNVTFVRPDSTVARIKSITDRSVVVGTGVRDSKDVAYIKNSGADGVVCGSAIALEIERNLSVRGLMLDAVGKKIRSMKEACK